MNPLLFCSERLYKIKPWTVVLAVHFFDRLETHLQEHGSNPCGALDCLREEYRSLRIISYMVGGSCNPPGRHAVTGKSSPKDFHHTTGAPQSEAESINSVLMWVCRMGLPVTVLFNWSEYLSYQRDTDPGQCYRKSLDQNTNERIMLANGFFNLRTKDARTDDRIYGSLGCWEMESYAISKCNSLSEVYEDFIDIPNYLNEAEKLITFRFEKAIEIKFRPAFSFEYVCDQIRERLAGERAVYTRRKITKDPFPICVRLRDARAWLDRTLCEDERRFLRAARPGKDNFPDSWISTEVLVSYICGLPKDRFDRVVGVVAGEDTYQKHRFTIPSVRSMLSLLMVVMIASAARANPERSVGRRRKDEKAPENLYVVPLCCPMADKIPDAHRLSGMPLPNSDWDLVNTFFVANARQYIRTMDAGLNHFVDGDGDRYESYTGLSLDNNLHREIVKNLLLVSAVLRTTGDIPHLALFGKFASQNCTAEQKKYCGLDLPVTETLDLFISFLQAFPQKTYSTFLSAQHSGLLPSSFRQKERGVRLEKGLENYIGFLGNLTKAMPRIDSFLAKAEDMTRELFVEVLTKEIGACSLTEVTGDTKWLAHRILADVEMVLLDVFGPVELGSIGFGFGSEFGVEVLYEIILQNTFEGRLGEIHLAVEEEMKVLPQDDIFWLGWKRDRHGNVLSRITGRRFSLTDTEHMLCKVYICALKVHPSRNDSETKAAAPSYIWPTHDTYAWAEPVLRLFDEMWNRFSEKGECKFVEDHFPKHFHYQEAYWVGGHDDEHEEEPIVAEV